MRRHGPLCGLADLMEHIVQIAEYLLVPEAEYLVAELTQVVGSDLVICSLVLDVMARAVQFDDQFLFRTTKIKDERPEGVLAAEAEAIQLSLAKGVSQHALGGGQIAPHGSRRCFALTSRASDPRCRLHSWRGCGQAR